MRLSISTGIMGTLIRGVSSTHVNQMDVAYNALYSASALDLTTAEKDSHLHRFVAELERRGGSGDIEAVFRSSVPAILESTVAIVNRASGVLWTASVDVPRFIGASLADARHQCGSRLNSPKKASLPRITHEVEGDIPDFFDSRTAFGPECSELIGTALDQSNCGSCWSFSTTTALEDRVCLASKGTAKTHLSPLDTLSCCNMENGCESEGCNGGDPASAWEWFVQDGVVTGGVYDDPSTCKPYAFPQCAHHVTVPGLNPCSGGAEFETPECTAKCTNSAYKTDYKKDKRHAVTAYSVAADEKSIKIEIMKNGPVSAAFMVFEDFLAYTGGVYHHVTGESVGGHAVKLIGWGKEKYWLLVNSWNPSWGEKGTFRMRLHEGGVMDEITAGSVHAALEDETEISFQEE